MRTSTKLFIGSVLLILGGGALLIWGTSFKVELTGMVSLLIGVMYAILALATSLVE